MNLSNLKPAEGSTKQRKRVGRGQGSGRGGTSTRGHKGAKSRSGYSRKIGFEGGQMPLQRRVPKFGFTNINRKEFKGINLDTLQALIDNKKLKKVTKEDLVQNGLAGKKDLIKILGRGELKAKVEITVDAFSKSAVAAIEKAGGKAVALVVKEEKVEEAKPKAKAAPKAKKEEAPEAKAEEAPAEEAKEEAKPSEEKSDEGTDAKEE